MRGLNGDRLRRTAFHTLCWEGGICHEEDASIKRCTRQMPIAEAVTHSSLCSVIMPGSPPESELVSLSD